MSVIHVVNPPHCAALSNCVPMNLECPNCHAAYEVPDRRLGPRRVVRCGSCDHTWPAPPADPDSIGAAGSLDGPVGPSPPLPEAHGAAGDETATEEAAGDEAGELAAPVDRLAAAPHSTLLIGAWLMSVLLIVASGAAAYAWRADVALAWPPAARILPIPSGTPAAVADRGPLDRGRNGAGAGGADAAPHGLKAPPRLPG